MIIECVANFSEGRDQETVAALAKAIRNASGVSLLDIHTDPDHHRSVFTFVGPPTPLKVAVISSVKVARDRIDLTRHCGTHPRMGACDVCPFVPIRDADMRDCIILAREAGAMIGSLGIPVFLYGEAADRPNRKNLALIRNREQFEGLSKRIGKDPEWTPEFGPEAIHPTAGAVAVGARPPMVAFNVNLESDDLSIARKISRGVRERDGGLPGVRALGMLMEKEKTAQVSMNLCAPLETPPLTVYREIEKLAAAEGVGVRSSELVGLAPLAALPAEAVGELKLVNFSPDMVIENRL